MGTDSIKSINFFSDSRNFFSAFLMSVISIIASIAPVIFPLISFIGADITFNAFPVLNSSSFVENLVIIFPVLRTCFTEQCGQTSSFP